jgi:FKBP-type peptidyl-prolyl cis-trans isomerase FkpA
MRTLIATALTVLIATTASAADTGRTEEEKTLYAIGMSVSRSLSAFDLSPAELELVKQGLTDAGSGKKSEVDLAVYDRKIQELARVRRKASGERSSAAGKEFLEKAAKEKGAVKTASGMVYKSLAEGNGTSPEITDVVKAHYRGTRIDGVEFDSSYKRGNPLEFKLDNVIACWTEGVHMMKPGGKASFVCPPQLAYGEKGAGDLILPGATLLFEVELLESKPGSVTQLSGR